MNDLSYSHAADRVSHYLFSFTEELNNRSNQDILQAVSSYVVKDHAKEIEHNLKTALQHLAFECHCPPHLCHTLIRLLQQDWTTS